MAKRTKQPQAAVERTQVAHERASGYRVIFADGALIRTQKNDVLVTFYHDDVPVRSERAESKKQVDGSSRYRLLGDFTQEFVRSHEVTVRMNLEDCASLISALLTRLSKESPELLKASGLEILRQESS